jgi:hypothetical protein
MRVALVVGIVVLALVLNGVLLWFIFRAIKNAIARQAEELAKEGIVKDSGSVGITEHLRDFRAPGMRVSVGARAGVGRLILTKERLALLPLNRRHGISLLPRADLARFTATARDGELHLHTDDPPNATGSIEVVVTVPDSDAWVDALTAAGAKR